MLLQWGGMPGVTGSLAGSPAGWEEGSCTQQEHPAVGDIEPRSQPRISAFRNSAMN